MPSSCIRNKKKTLVYSLVKVYQLKKAFPPLVFFLFSVFCFFFWRKEVFICNIINVNVSWYDESEKKSNTPVISKKTKGTLMHTIHSALSCFEKESTSENVCFHTLSRLKPAGSHVEQAVGIQLLL